MYVSNTLKRFCLIRVATASAYSVADYVAIGISLTTSVMILEILKHAYYVTHSQYNKGKNQISGEKEKVVMPNNNLIPCSAHF